MRAMVLCLLLVMPVTAARCRDTACVEVMQAREGALRIAEAALLHDCRRSCKRQRVWRAVGYSTMFTAFITAVAAFVAVWVVAAQDTDGPAGLASVADGAD